LTVATVLASSTPALASGVEAHSKHTLEGLKRGAKPSEVRGSKVTRPVTVKDARLDLHKRIHESNKSRRWNPIDLPDSIDPRGTTLETAVRDQGQQGLCWAYASTDVLAIAKKKQIGASVEYSPNFLNYMQAGQTLDFEGGGRYYKPDALSLNPYAQWDFGGYPYLDDGGDAAYVSENLQVHQTRPVAEADFPTMEYVEEMGGMYGSWQLAEEPLENLDALLGIKALGDATADVKNVVKVQGIHESSSDAVAEHTQKIKALIAQYGAGVMYINGELLFTNFTKNVASGNVYNNEHNALNVPFDYNGGDGEISVRYQGYTYDVDVFEHNHEVTVVGYDDNYSRDNFNEDVRPTSDGAFLVKNSWGAYSHDGGYFWVSYEAATMALYDVISFQLGAHDEHKIIDNAKSTSSIDIYANDFPEFSGKTYVAETFDAADVDRNVKNINVDLAGENVRYRASIVEGDLNIGGVNSDASSEFDHQIAYTDFAAHAKKVVTGSSKYSGEQKLPFDFKLKAGRKYTVIVEEAVPSTTDVDYIINANPYIAPSEMPGASYMGVISGGDVYSLDFKTSDFFVTDIYARVAAQNNLSLDWK
jgi:hypothetical protein